MILEIKKVPSCKDNAYGTFVIVGQQKARIEISLKRNKTLAEYATTMIHELLHLYTALLKAEGFEVKERIEHKWIESCEVVITNLMLQILKRRK